MHDINTALNIQRRYLQKWFVSLCSEIALKSALAFHAPAII